MEVIAVEKTLFKHQQVEAELRSLMESLPVGARLPPERSLAEQYGCNFLTVRRAMKRLVEDGSVVRRVGSGTFVASRAGLRRGAGPAVELIGVLVWQGGDAYAYRVLQALAQQSAANGVELRSDWITDFGRDGLAKAKLLEQQGCIAITLPWFPHDRRDEVREFVRSCGLPVSLPMVIPGLEINSFEQQEVFGNSMQDSAEQLCAYFHALGHRRIALLGPDLPGDRMMQRFLSAYACYTSRMGLPNFCGLVLAGGPSMDALAERWSAFRGDFAVVSHDDGHALRFMTAMHKLGLSAPRDFQIVGYNDTEACAYSDPPLSTVRQSFDYIGYWLIKTARGLARGEVDQSTSPPRTQMVVRVSCGGAGRIDERLRQQLTGLDIVE